MALIDAILAYWKLDEANGTRNDSHGTSHLSDNNTVGSAAGRIGNAADFEISDSEYLSCADNAALSQGDNDWTLNLWVKMESNTSQEFVNKGDAGGYEYRVGYNAGFEWFEFVVYSADGFGGPGGMVSLSLGPPAIETWYMITVWHDSVANQVGIAVNAGTADTISHSLGTYDGDGPFYVGRNAFGGFADGLIDEIGLWRRVLTSQERTDLYNGGNGLAYPFASGRVLSAKSMDGGFRDRMTGGFAA